VLRFEWDALRIGNPVLVHDGDAMALRTGEVTMVQSRPSRNDANVVSIRLDAGDEPSRVVAPTFSTVHLSPLERSERCWRCVALEHVASVVSRGARAR
jgi:hypothetical protein